MTAWTVFADAWNSFFYAPEPAYTIALFRILFGCVLLANVALFVGDARFWFGPTGALAHDDYRRLFGHSQFTFLRYLPASDASLYLVLGMHVVAAVLLTLGLATRLSAAVVFVTLLSIQHRNPFVRYGADDVLRVMSFLLIFSRAEEIWSLDHWLGRTPGNRAGTAWCSRLMQLQVSLIYFQAFLSKFEGRTWLDGTAVYYAVESPDFRRSRLPKFARNLFWSRLATWGTLVIEFSLGPMVWIRELRYPVLIAGVALHLGMEVFMNLQLFGATMIVCLTLFIDPYHLAELWSTVK